MIGIFALVLCFSSFRSTAKPVACLKDDLSNYLKVNCSAEGIFGGSCESGDCPAGTLAECRGGLFGAKCSCKKVTATSITKAPAARIALIVKNNWDFNFQVSEAQNFRFNQFKNFLTSIDNGIAQQVSDSYNQLKNSDNIDIYIENVNVIMKSLLSLNETDRNKVVSFFKDTLGVEVVFGD